MEKTQVQQIFNYLDRDRAEIFCDNAKLFDNSEGNKIIWDDENEMILSVGISNNFRTACRGAKEPKPMLIRMTDYSTIQFITQTMTMNEFADLLLKVVSDGTINAEEKNELIAYFNNVINV